MNSMINKPILGVLLVPLVLVIGMARIQAQEDAGRASGNFIVYETILLNTGPSEVQLARLEAVLPPDTQYVGLAADSQVTREAQRLGNRLIWEGPLSVPANGKLVLRYWLAPASPEAEALPVEVFAEGVEEQTAPAPQAIAPHVAETPASERVVGSQDVTAEKKAETPVLYSGDEPWVAYVVTFTNSISTTAVLELITDTLAPGFEFVGMAAGSDVGTPPIDPEDSPIVWEDLEVPGEGALRLRYWAKASDEVGVHFNSVQAMGGSETVGPVDAHITVKGPALIIDKLAASDTVTSTNPVSYTVTISNTSMEQRVIDSISDTLPAGFTYQAMDVTSDIDADPVVENGTLVWYGPIVVDPKTEIRLVYVVGTFGAGTQTNRAVARDDLGNLLGPAEAEVTTLTVKVSVYLPLVFANYLWLPPGFLMEDTFDTGIAPEWTPFVNYPGLNANQWSWRGGTGWGRYDYDAPGDPGYDSWGLSMYQREGSEAWTDYRIEATLRTSDRADNPMAGIWFRGTHEQQFDQQGGQVTGYYLLLKPIDNWVLLAKIRASDQEFNKVEWIPVGQQVSKLKSGTFYDIAVEVDGARIRCWFEDELVIDWVDPSPWPNGTVGLVAFRGGGFDYIHTKELGY